MKEYPIVNGKIKSIEETEGSYTVFFEDNTKLYLTIGEFQSCCESWGCYVQCQDDDYKYFIGSLATKIEIDVVCTMGEHTISDAGGIMFMKLWTNRGVCTFCVYNEHNGYYSHNGKVIYFNEHEKPITLFEAGV